MIVGKAAPGDRTVQGHVVMALQTALTRSGQAAKADGVLGNDTAEALRRWQVANGLAGTARLDGDGWRHLTRSEPPSPFDLCLAVTADFEGTAFDRVAGNFDGAGITFGLIGFTLANGELKRLMAAIEALRPGAVASSFGSLFPEFAEILDASKTRQAEWANGISRGPSMANVDPHWAAAFARLGALPEARQAQVQRARDVYWQAAMRMMGPVLGQRPVSLLDAALFFDIAVQNSVPAEERAAMAAAGQAASGAELRNRIATIISEGSAPKWRKDVLGRKRCFGQGSGSVHGSRYTLDVWGLDDTPLPPGALDLPAMASGLTTPGSGAAADIALAPDDEAGEARAFLMTPPVVPVPAAPAASIHAGWELYDRFTAFVATLGLRHFSADELLFLGNQQAGGQCAGLNFHPPEELWRNIAPTAAVLDRLRQELGAPIRVLSAYRSPPYNACIDGSATNSMHMRYNAIDFACQVGRPADWAAKLQGYRANSVFRGGIGVYRSFVHLDTRGENATWTG